MFYMAELNPYRNYFEELCCRSRRYCGTMALIRS
jgi:hypothetical protein